jgi:DNA-binding MarR family transcriptional regulator
VITAKALAVLEEIVLNPRHGAARGISKKLGLGRDSTQRYITELREAGLVETVNLKIGALGFNKLLRPTEDGIKEFTLSTSIRTSISTSIQHNELYSNLILNTNTFINKKIVLGEAQGGEETMSDEWYSLGQVEQDPEEMAELKRRDKKRRDREYRDTRNAKAEKTMASKINRTPADWTIDNAVFEFASRMVRWDVSPWESSRRPFQAAFARSRRDFDTNGEVEVMMMDIFFGRLDHEKKLKDPDMVWKLFIRDFNSLRIAAEQRMVTPEMIVKAEEISDKQWEAF